jgi:hypothetical protein
MKPGLPGWEPPNRSHLIGVIFVTKLGGRYRIRTYDFHRVKMALYR